ncbi:hypothetical protein ACQ4M3_08120 [Leptolyngbya sp. AN03gr2]|uniref:hypothetical protein n=1 Tax=unclassified Leptolyngbya TaxID=2650499 RepID=UPI003D31CA7D
MSIKNLSLSLTGQISQICRLALQDIEAMLNELDQNIFTIRTSYYFPIAQHRISSIEKLVRTISECEDISVEQVMREIRWGDRWQEVPPDCVPEWGTPTEFPNVVDDESETAHSETKPDWLNPEWLTINYAAPRLRDYFEETLDDPHLLARLCHLSDVELNHAAFRVIQHVDSRNRYHKDAIEVLQDAIEHSEKEQPS